MITNEQIRQTINDCAKAGHNIGMRDISYVLLCEHYQEPSTAYKILFGLDADFNAAYADTYHNTGDMEYLRNYMALLDTSPTTKRRRKVNPQDDITFEENKAEMLRIIKTTKEALASGEIEVKDALRIEADLRVKLNDKFQVKEDVKDQVVIVTQKYDDICPRCGIELARRPITKEEAMEMYNLIEKE